MSTSLITYRRPNPAILAAIAAATILLMAITSVRAQDLSVSPPPAPYVSVADILPLPAFIPGAGALFIDPANAPVGPWLSYGADGNLLEILFMVPLSGMTAAQNWDNLATGLFGELGATVDQVDISYNGGHPGMAEPHYHIRLVLVDDATQQAQLTQ